MLAEQLLESFFVNILKISGSYYGEFSWLEDLQFGVFYNLARAVSSSWKETIL
jgi:hypothetical protein